MPDDRPSLSTFARRLLGLARGEPSADTSEPGTTPRGAPHPTPTFDHRPAAPDAPTPSFDAPAASLPVPRVPGYRDVTFLQKGGMGAVFRATQEGFDRPVAIKLIAGSGAYDPETRRRFATEVRSVAAAEHPNVVRVYEVSATDDGVPFFSMEYMAGGSLADRPKDGPPDDRATAGLMAGVAAGVAAAHARGVLHRDLKPSNVLLAADGTPKVTDFGLAKVTADDQTRTEPTKLLGTPAYMAPEQAAPRPDEVSERTDVYGLGATLYDLLTGRPPFAGATVEEVRQRVQFEDVVPPSRVRPGVPTDLEAVCLACLEKEPAKRYPTARAFADDLNRWLAGEATEARPATRLQKATKWARRHRAKLAAAAGLVLVVAGVAALPNPRRDIERRLARGETVTLIPEVGNPWWSEWAAGEVPLAGSTEEDGTCGFQTHVTSVLTLVRDPQHDAYQLSAELRHIKAHADDAAVGVFVGLHEPAAGPGLRTTRFVGVEYSDFWRKAELDNPNLRKNHGLDGRDLVVVRDGRSSESNWVDGGVFRFTPSNAGANGWRSVVVDVSPAGVTAYWGPQGAGGKPALRFTAAWIAANAADHTRNNAGRFPGFDLPARPWTPRAALGVYARDSAVSFRNVVVRPLPLP